ncbi:MAG: EAL domain-containing protein, partial [Pseudomonadota bacterium]|nr:EAL domain-containing protein [Pseudomonadota bacterium]
MDGQLSPLKVLLVEDSPADAQLILRALRDLPRPFEHERVASADALRDALARFQPDVILSDFSMPGFSGQEALEIAISLAPELPLVFVSGATGEELAIDAMQRGALDYVLKDNLRRLPSAIQGALHTARNRVQREDLARALRANEARFRSIVETSKDWIWEMDPQGRQTYANAAVESVLGYSPKELLGKDSLVHLLPEDRAEVERLMPGLMARKLPWHNWPLRWRHRDGSVRTLVSNATPMLDDAGELTGYRGIDHDITERLEQDAQIRKLARLHGVLADTSSAVLRAGSREQVLSEACRVAVERGGFLAACIGSLAKDRSVRMIGSHGDEQVIQMLRDIGQRTRGIDDPAQMSAGARALQTSMQVVTADLASAHDVPEWVRAGMADVGVAAQVLLPIGNPAWGVLGLYVAQPQTFDEEELALVERLANEIDFAVDLISKSERLAYLAYHNAVSGLPNRASLHAHLETWLHREPLTIALLNIQNFVAINDSRGRAFGDALLQRAGQRLRALVGETALLAHIEGQTFAVVYKTFGAPEVESDRLETVMEAFERESFTANDVDVHITLCAGLAFSPAHGADAETLEHAALAALGECNKQGLRIHIFNEELRGRAGRRLTLEHELRRAIADKQFELFYQPKFNAATQQLVGAEALLRWRHPERGLVSPAEFIPVLEESGLIVAVGHWVMGDALRRALAWRALRPDLRIAVNVSARELRDPRFLEECQALLLPHADDQPLDIEVTESLLMQNIEASIHLLDSLRAMGCKIEIDDFGTGYSSLNYLARLPADTLKIDQSFIALLNQSPQTLSLVTNIINLAHSLSLNVVAEGVEEEGQAHLLRLLRCDVLQGYL